MELLGLSQDHLEVGKENDMRDGSRGLGGEGHRRHRAFHLGGNAVLALMMMAPVS